MGVTLEIEIQSEIECVCARVIVCVGVHVCVCVSERETERERMSKISDRGFFPHFCRAQQPRMKSVRGEIKNSWK